MFQCESRGELLASLSYQPVSHRLSVVVLKARHLPKMDMTGLSASEWGGGGGLLVLDERHSTNINTEMT